MKSSLVKGNLVDLYNRSIYPASIEISNGIITNIQKINESFDGEGFILPGFIDAHIHIESSMLVPTEFAQIALKHGTVATVSDPHEIANVLGVEGVSYMIRNAAQSPLKFTFGAPSCVPATQFETAGAQISDKDISYMFDELGLTYLSEMMNYPGVIHGDKSVLDKIKQAQIRNLPIDGHSPGLIGDDLIQYASFGISTDHECFTYDEAVVKLRLGMKVIIREGSAAKNYPALHPLINDYADFLMFCSDDKHPDDLINGHMNDLVSRAIKDGYDLFQVLKIACLNPIEHYKLKVGALVVGDPADFIKVHDLEDFKVKDVWVDGKQVVHSGEIRTNKIPIEIVNNFNCRKLTCSDIHVKNTGSSLRVIEAINGELITESFDYPIDPKAVKIDSETKDDILKIVVHNRYQPTNPSVAFINGFNLQKGAIASSVAHDCHNIVAVGVSDAAIVEAVNAIIDSKGGICVNDGHSNHLMKLPIAGIMSDLSAEEAGQKYSDLDFKAKELGSKLNAPFMTLSFMALLVIPSLKLSDQGLFSADEFDFVSLTQ